MQEKIPDKDLSRILKGVGLIALGSGKIAGAVGLAVISAPFCVAGIGVGGERTCRTDGKRSGKGKQGSRRRGR